MLKLESSFKLPKEVKTEGKVSTLAQAMRVYEARSHFGLAKTKSRGEVNRTTKKVYKQKGTGGARHGARSAPIYVGGGTTFGPHPYERRLRLSKGMGKNSLKVSLAAKEKDDKVVVASGFSTLKGTKEVSAFLSKLKAKRFTVALSKENMDKARFVKNIKGVVVLPFENLNARQVVLGGTLVLDKAVFGKEKVEKTVKKNA